MSQWPSFHRTLWADHRRLLRGASATERLRLTKSAIRTSSFLYMMSLALRGQFDPRAAVLTGLLAALFDDLFDERREPPDAIRSLVESPESARVRSVDGVLFRHLYKTLLERLAPCQRDQMVAILGRLVELESGLLDGPACGEHWSRRGATAFMVYLTVQGVPESSVNPGPIAVLGEYLQMMDDYEDVDIDAPAVNYFKNHPGADVDRFYAERVAPALGLLFLDHEATRRFDPELLGEFLETYHVFQADYFRAKHPNGRSPAAAPAGGAAARRADLPGPPGGLPLRALWHASDWFTGAWSRYVPSQPRLIATRLIVSAFRGLIPF